MLRVTFTFIAFLSLLLCIASLCAWPSSYRYITGAGFNIVPSHNVGFEIHRGWISFFHVRDSNGELGSYAYCDPPIGSSSRRVAVRQFGDEDSSWFPLPDIFSTIHLPLWLFALITALLPALWFWIVLTRPRRRRRRGACARCGYDLRGNPATATCPECGSTLQRSPDGTP